MWKLQGFGMVTLLKGESSMVQFFYKLQTRFIKLLGHVGRLPDLRIFYFNNLLFLLGADKLPLLEKKGLRRFWWKEGIIWALFNHYLKGLRALRKGFPGNLKFFL